MPGISVWLHALLPDAVSLDGDSLGARLVRTSRERGLSRQEAADELRVSSKTLMWREQNVREPTDRM